jgi:very-short-patch-repair endonuclease
MPRTLRWDPPRHPFKLEHVAKLGVTPRVLVSAQRSGRIVRLARGVYVAADALAADPIDAHLQRAGAHQLLLPRGIASHSTAALAWGLDLDDPQREAMGPVRFIETAGAATRARRSPGLRIAVRDLPPQDRAQHPSGLIVTTRDRTAVDVAAECRLPEALITLDSAARQNLRQAAGRDWIRDTARSHGARAASVRPLADAAQRAATQFSRRHLERVLPLVDGRRESPAESLSFGHMALVGLPLPDVQVMLVDELGELYVDFLWWDAGLVGEVDGNLKYTTPEALVAERRRQRRVEARGLRVVRWEAMAIRRRPLAVMEHIARHLGL